jgi:hypothetical protein
MVMALKHTSRRIEEPGRSARLFFDPLAGKTPSLAGITLDSRPRSILKYQKFRISDI